MAADKAIIDYIESAGKRLITYWHEKKLEQIRLETANKKHIEQEKAKGVILARKNQKLNNVGNYGRKN